jgi:hypothetical protein
MYNRAASRPLGNEHGLTTICSNLTAGEAKS